MEVEIRSGTITSNRIDSAEKNVEKEKFECFQSFYKDVLLHVSTYIRILEELTKPTKENKIFAEHCPVFRTAVFQNFWAQSVIKLNECFKGKHSFQNCINYIEANWNKIYTGKWEDITDWDDNTTDREVISFGQKEIFEQIEEIKKVLDSEENKQIIKKIKAFRDQVFAHIDDEAPKDNISLKELRQVFKFAELIYNKLQVMYDRTEMRLEFLNADDIRNLVFIVNIYDKYQKEIREIDWKARYEK